MKRLQREPKPNHNRDTHDETGTCHASMCCNNDTMADNDRIGVLFLCLGNICRSPLAEAVFLHRINQREVADRFHVDSAGTGAWHVGEPPDPRMREVAQQYGVKLAGRARQIRTNDLDAFDYILCADEQNRKNALRMGARPDQARLFLEFDPKAPMKEIPDPYYGGDEGFHNVFELVQSGCDAVIDHLLTERTTSKS